MPNGLAHLQTASRNTISSGPEMKDDAVGCGDEIRDLAGDGDHYAARVVSSSFRGLNRVRQHQLVYQALGGRMGGELHALQLETAAPDGD